jgi:hypothetical protein
MGKGCPIPHAKIVTSCIYLSSAFPPPPIARIIETAGGHATPSKRDAEKMYVCRAPIWGVIYDSKG